MRSSPDPAPPARAREAGLVTLVAKADGGDADAQFGLGLQCATAAGEALDLVQAAAWYRKAADQNHVLAQFNLGMMFACGQGMPRDEVQAAHWIRRAAEGGDAGGQYDLGSRCHRASVDRHCGDAQEARIEAYKWFHLAAELGYRDSDIACQRLALTMSRTEIDEANHRAAAFVPRNAPSPALS